MKYKQEKHAKELYNDLLKELNSQISETSVSVSGERVHWHCKAIRGNRDCKVHCFEGPEYYVDFNQASQAMATGRTSVRQDIVAAVQNWLDRHAVKNLYEQFDFVDREKRGLEVIKSKIVGHCPELEQCNLDLRCVWGDLYRLELSKNDRECRISYYAKNEIPDTLVHWDGAVLFQVQTSDYEQLALALKRWLYDCAMPSDLEKEFPWIDIGKLAKYYEEGRGVEGEFLLSWEFVESFYTEWINHPNKREILELISKIKAHGYERTLRAGQSLYSLVLSRSRRHGLRQDQPWLTFDFRESGMDVRASFIKGEAIHFTSYEFIAELDALLRQLESMEID